jgi:hypothetical protein
MPESCQGAAEQVPADCRAHRHQACLLWRVVNGISQYWTQAATSQVQVVSWQALWGVTAAQLCGQWRCLGGLCLVLYCLWTMGVGHRSWHSALQGVAIAAAC